MPKDNRPRYECKCPECGKQLWVCKSIFHEMGLNDQGSGFCLHCGAFLRFTFEPETQIMTPAKYSRREEVQPNA